jgi:hypothetical protein
MSPRGADDLTTFEQAQRPEQSRARHPGHIRATSELDVFNVSQRWSGPQRGPNKILKMLQPPDSGGCMSGQYWD